jgi:hypothetical protein
MKSSGIPAIPATPWLRIIPAVLAGLFASLAPAAADTVFSANFNNGTGTAGDKNANFYHWSAAIGSSGTLDSSLAGAPASVGISQGTTAGVPTIGGATNAGFLFALPDAAPAVMLLHTTHLTSSTNLQDAPQGDWFRAGPQPLAGQTVGNLARLSVFTRPATATTVMRFAIRANGQWFASASSFTHQGALGSFEEHSIESLTAQDAWLPFSFQPGSTLTADPSSATLSTLDPSWEITGYGIHAHTGTQSGASARLRIDSFRVTTRFASQGAVVSFAGNSGEEQFLDAMRLSDGSLLIAGSASNLDWTTAPKQQLPPLDIPHRNTGRTAFLMRVSDDLASIQHIWHLPPGQSLDFRWIKGTHKPGQPTGDLFLSGSCDSTSGDYFIARLSPDFLTENPASFAWTRLARMSNAHGDNLEVQSWDVGGDGRVAFADETGGNLRVFFLNPAGQLTKLPALRGSHWNTGTPLDGTNRQQGIGSDLPDTAISGITFPTDLRSWTEDDRLAILPDGNGQIKRGTWPLDLFTPVQDKDGTTTGTITYGYTGYRSAGRFRLGAIAINRDTNAFSIGFNINSRFWDAPANKEQPDFEPAVIAYHADGSLNWWSRLYHEAEDTNQNNQIDPGETRLSSPDQYVDGLAIDYSASPARLVVLARCHGNNTTNLWRGNEIAATPGANGFHNQFTGTEGNIHIGWIGKFRETDGTLLRASYLAGYLRNTVLTQAAYADPVLDGWPSHNAGWASLTTTRATPGALRTDADGRVYVVGTGPRMVTTANAWQKLPRITPAIDQGIAPWNQFARVFAPDLDTLVYSTAITGEWTYPEPGAQPIGAANTDLFGIYPADQGLIAVGRQRNEGNPVPTQNVPPWGNTAPAGESALFAMLPFSGGGTAGSSLPAVSLAPTVAPAPVSGTTATLTTLATDPNDPESALQYTWSVVTAPPGGSASFSPNGDNAAKQSTATFTRAGSYTLRLRVTNTLGRTVDDDFPVTVAATPAALAIQPATAQPGTFTPFPFTAEIIDQFGQTAPAQNITWQLTGEGQLDSGGIYTAPATPGGPYQITATLGHLTAQATVTVVPSNIPRISLPATHIGQTQPAGLTVATTLPLANIGTQPLTWSAQALLPTGGEITTFETSAQPNGPTYSWIDIASGSNTIWQPTGSAAIDDSNTAITFPPGFQFPYYGTTHSQVRVCTNGFLLFSTSSNTAYNNLTLPTTTTPSLANLVAVLWADWIVDSSAWVKWKLTQPDTLVITWHNLLRFGTTTQRATFQCILKSNGDIITQIQSFTPTDRNYTLGIQNQNFTKHILAAHNPATHFIPTGAASHFAIRYPLPPATPPWLTLHPASAITPAGASAPLGLTYHSAGLPPGTHSAILRLTSNDPIEPTIDLPVSLNIAPWSPIEAWRHLHFGTNQNINSAADTADPDQDGIVNLIEFALLDGDPLSPSHAILPAASLSTHAGQDYLTLTVHKNPTATGITYQPEISGDLLTWNHEPTHIVTLQDTHEILIARDATPLPNHHQRFIRLKITRP